MDKVELAMFNEEYLKKFGSWVLEKKDLNGRTGMDPTLLMTMKFAKLLKSFQNQSPNFSCMKTEGVFYLTLNLQVCCPKLGRIKNSMAGNWNYYLQD